GVKEILKRIPVRLAFGIDVLDEIEVRLLVRRIVGLTGHIDVAPRALLIDRRAQFAAVGDPAFELLRVFDLRGLLFKLLEEWLEVRTIAEVCLLGNELTGLGGFEFFEGCDGHWLVSKLKDLVCRYGGELKWKIKVSHFHGNDKRYFATSSSVGCGPYHSVRSS